MKLLNLLLFAILFNQFSFSQETYIPFRDGVKWGFADTTGAIIIKPIYEKIGTYKSGVFIMEENDRTTVLNKKSDIVIPSVKGKIHVSENYIKIKEKVNGKYLSSYFSLRGESLFPKNIVNADCMLFHGKVYCTLETKTGKQALTEVSDEFMTISKWLIDTSEIEFKGKINSNFVGNFVIKSNPAGNDGTQIVADVPAIFKDENHPYVMKYTLGKLEKINGMQLVQSNNISRKRRLIESIKDTLPKIYKEIHLLENHQFAKKSVDQTTDTIIKMNSLAIVTENNNLKGVVNCNGEEIVPTIYEEIDTNYLMLHCNKICLIVRKNNKWGVISRDSIIIPFKYDTLFMVNKFLSGSLCYKKRFAFIGKRAEKYLLVNGSGVIGNDEYDEVKYDNKAHCYITRIAGKYGYINALHFGVKRFYTKPIFDYPHNNLTQINNYTVIEERDDSGNLLGYIDLKGFNYFIK